MQTIAISMQKGGSGKTTTAVNLAAGLAKRGQRVLVVDLDPQGNASSWLGADETEVGMYGVLADNLKLKSVIQKTASPNLSIAPASKWLVGIERALASKVGAETLLRKKLKEVARDYDVALIDTPPMLSTVTVNALVAADWVIVPTETHALSLHGLAQIMETIDAVKDRLNNKLRLLGILATRVNVKTKHANEVLAAMKKSFAKLTFSAIIRENVKLAEAPSFNKSIFEYDAKGTATADYKKLSAEVLKKMQQPIRGKR